MAMKRRTPVCITIAAAIVLGISVLIARVISTADKLLAMETRLQSTMVAAAITSRFVLAQDPPRWPASWDELAAIQHDHPSLPWPGEREVIERNVIINFNTTLEAVLGQPEESLDAIRPNGDCYSVWRTHVWHTLVPAREALAP